MKTQDVINKITEEETEAEVKETVWAFNKNMEGIAEIASKDVTRYALQNIRFSSEGYAEACDGTILLRVPLDSINIVELPTGFEPARPEDSALMPRDKFKMACKNIPKTSLNVCNYAYVSKQNGEVSLMSTDLDSTLVVSNKDNGYEFPDTDLVMKEAQDNKKVFTIGLSVSVLEKLVKAVKKLSGPDTGIKFEFSSPETSVKLTFKAEGKECEGVLMPMRV